MHSLLVGIFSYFSQLHHSCVFRSYRISAYHLGRFQHCHLGKFVWRTQVQTESRGFYFPCCTILQRNFPNFGMEILALHSAKSFWGLFFSYFCSRVVHSVFLTQIISCRQKNADAKVVLSISHWNSHWQFSKNCIFPNIQLKGVVNRLPPFKNLSDNTNKFLMG